ncbi:hypothetical protein CMI37_16575 [Candidatus Pacearchaeota archaeon]|nr:hypothetical protein [Candidatus Pacearchaeota archaeon]
MSRLPVEELPARLRPLNLAGTEVHHLPDWKGYDDPKRMAVIAHIAKMRGRDPRIASLAVSILKKAKVKPRQYKKQAAALLKWVQDPKNIYYVNEPGERLQDPIFTIKQGWGDCDDQCLTLAALFESIRLPWKLVLGGTCNGKKVRYIQGQEFPQGCQWAHIYLMVGTPPFKPNRWYFAETTVQGVPLGWDVVSGSKRYLPEMETRPLGPAYVVKAPRPPRGHRPVPLPPAPHRSPAYAMAFQPSRLSTSEYGQSALSPVGAAVGASMAAGMEGEDSWMWDPNWTPEQKVKETWIDVKKILPAVITGVVISVGTQLILDYIRPRFGLRRGK